MNEITKFLILAIIITQLSQPVFPAAAPDWKNDINLKLKSGLYEEAMSVLDSVLPGLEKIEKQEAMVLRPFILNLLGKNEEEKKALIDYFEEFDRNQPVLEFLDFSIFSQLLEYWDKWQENFPLLNNLNFLVPVNSPENSIPEALRIGFDLSTRSYYKLILDDQPLEGGLWEKGPHLVELPMPYSYEKPFTLNLDIHLRTELITIKKRVVIEFNVDTRRPAGQDLLVQKQTSSSVKNLVGEVSLYIGDTLIYKATKYVPKKIPIKINIPPPNPPGTKPYLIPQKDQYPFRGVSIIDAISAISKVIQDWKKKPPSSVTPTYEKKTELVFNFVHPESPEVRSRITIKLKPIRAEYYQR